MRRYLLAFCLSCIAPLAAQAGSGGSSYSVLGIGDIRYLPGVRAAGMGYANIAVPAPNSVNVISPGTWSGLSRVRAEGMLLYEGFKSTDGTRSRYLAQADFAGALLGVPVSAANGFTFVAGFTPFSNVSFNTFSNDTYVGADTLLYRLQHVGTGGVNRAVLGFSYRPLQSLSVGAGFEYLFGTIEKTLTMTQVSGTFSGGTTTETMTFKGSMVRLGAVFNGFGAVAGALEPISLGGFVVSRGTIGTATQRAFDYGPSSSSILNLQDTTLEAHNNLVVPFSFGLGISYQLNERTLIALDYVNEPWRRSELNGSTPAGIRNASQWNVGLEYAGSREGSWLQRTALRLGFAYHPTYYRPSGEPINEWLVTGGVSFPLGGENRLHLAGEYGTRGTNNRSLIKENIFRFSVALSIGETWFERPEEE